jgi:hypothetical protein
VSKAVEPLTDYRLALARALVAACVHLHRETHELPDGALPMGGDARDRLVELIVAALGGREAGVTDWVKSKAGGLIKGVGTRWVRRRRGRLSDQFAPFGADVIVYQTRPQPMRRFIRDTIGKASAAARARGESGEVSVIAHRLGGIATVDLLIEEGMPLVRHLITVGSQAPLLYELDALGSRPILRNADGSVKAVPHPLPDHFPASWLNIYDPRDFLSYRAAAIFGSERVSDLEVDNDQPFPESHSAYWDNPRVWDAVTARIGKGS